MLGFVTLSETPLSQVTTATVANAFLPNVSAQTEAGGLALVAKANITSSSVLAGTNVNIEFDAQASTLIPQSTATININSIVTDAQASIIPSPVTSVLMANAFADIDAKANRLIPATTLAVSSGTIGFDAQASGTLTGVLLNLNNFEFTDEDAQASIVLPSVTSSFTIPVLEDVDAKASIRTSNVQADIVARALVTDAQASAPVTGVALALNNFEFTDEDAKATTILPSIALSLTANLSDPVAVAFPYQDYADQYSRNRTFFLEEQDRSNTVHIRQHRSTTVYITKQDKNKTVYIAA
jgi:hypothetical protein